MHRLLAAIVGALLLPVSVASAADLISDAAVMIRVDEGRGESSVLSGVVVSSDGSTVVVITNAHGFRDPYHGIEIAWPGRGSAPAEMAYLGNPDDKRDDLAILVAQVNGHVPAAQFADRPAAEGDRLFVPGYPRAQPTVNLYSGPLLRRTADGGLIGGFSLTEGVSGSGVFNAEGRLVGIAWGTAAQAHVAECFAVDVSQVGRAIETSCRGRFGGILQRIRGRFTGQPQAYGQPQQFAPAGAPQSCGPQGCPTGPPPQQYAPQGRTIQQAPAAQAHGPEGSGPDLPRPDLNAPQSRPAPTAPQMAPAASITVGDIAERIAADGRLLDHLAADERFRGPEGPPGPPGAPGMKGPPAQVDYKRIAEHVRGDSDLIGSVAAVAGESIEIPTPEAETAGPGWLESITRTAAALGLEIAIPGGTAGTVALWGLSSYWRHRRQRLEIESRATGREWSAASPHPYAAPVPPPPSRPEPKEPPDPFPIDRPAT